MQKTARKVKTSKVKTFCFPWPSVPRKWQQPSENSAPWNEWLLQCNYSSSSYNRDKQHTQLKNQRSTTVPFYARSTPRTENEYSEDLDIKCSITV